MNNTNITSWTKAEWKYWLQSYITYYNALQVYLEVGINSVEGAVENILSVAEALIPGIVNEFGSDLGKIESIILSGAELVLQGANVTGTANFTEFWQPGFDLESVTISEILNDLSIASNVVVQVETWFTNVFLNSGLQAIF